MTLPVTDTVVSYPSGATSGTATVLHVDSLGDGRSAVLLDATPCHPVDAGWPDQGADRATLSWGENSATVVDCVVAATDGEHLYLGSDIPVRKGTEGWSFVVAHVLDGKAPAAGETVNVEVDAAPRRSLSVGHTGCHLVSLALNRTLADRWNKEAAADALGASNFDGLAIASSTITPFGSVDTFRLNKSLRRKGFVSEGLKEALPELTATVNVTLSGWVATGAAVNIRREGEHLTDRRYWECELPEGLASIACGGTHADSVTALGAITASLELTDDDTPVLTMTTTSQR